ncbi:MAG: PilZ domain-containing protein [Armatimonadetes bacterium]|nr:PilZ domain-containing protein [Armatimonadota bacterium]
MVLDLFKKLARRGREVDVVAYRNDFVHFKTRGGDRLQLGEVSVRAYLPGRPEPMGAIFSVRTYDQAVDLYTATVKENIDLVVILRQTFPPEPEPEFVPIPEPEPEEEQAPDWEEKRGETRFQRVLGVMGPQVPGFRCVTHDLSRHGLRLLADQPLESGQQLKLQVGLDDAGEPVHLTGRVLWAQPKPQTSGYWIGVRLVDNLPEAARQRLDTFLGKLEHGEQQVFLPGFDGLR